MRHRKWCASSSSVGFLKEATSSPAGSIAEKTWRTVPPLPLVSMPWSTTSRERVPSHPEALLQLVEALGERRHLVLGGVAVLDAGGGARIDARQDRASVGVGAQEVFDRTLGAHAAPFRSPAVMRR